MSQPTSDVCSVRMKIALILTSLTLTATMSALSLRSYFHFFLPEGDKDVFVCMPTGAGKSLVYQLPAAAKQGLSLVITPLIALMYDQLDHLSKLGIPAATLNSKISAAERNRLLTGQFVCNTI